MLVCHVSLSVCLSLSVCVSASVRRDADDLLLSPFSPSLKVGLNVAWLCPLLCRCLMGAHMYFYVCVCVGRVLVKCTCKEQMGAWLCGWLSAAGVSFPAVLYTSPPLLSLSCVRILLHCVCVCVCVEDVDVDVGS